MSLLQRSVRSVRHLASMEEEERRSLLRSLSDDEYRDIMCVLASMPNINMKTKIEGKYKIIPILLCFYNIKYCIFIMF